MKRLFALMISIIICAATLCATAGIRTQSVNAETQLQEVCYARAMVKDGYFFTQKDLATSLFAVPYTYCVQVIRDDGDWYYVKYAEDYGIYRALYGYCRKEDFILLSGKPEVTYLYKSISVTYRAEETSPNLPVLNELTVEAAFYGTYYAGATAYSYVLCQGSFGYISGANDDYPVNVTEDAGGQPAAEEEKEAEESGSGNEYITAIIIVGLAAAALILLFITAKKHSRIKGS